MASQVYSVWSDADRAYNYYKGPEVGPASPPRGPNPQLGVPADDAAVRLPLGVRHVGSGELAVGRVAEPGINWSSVGRIALWLLAAYGAYRLWRRS